MPPVQNSFWTRIGRIQNILQRYQPKKGQHFKELGPLVLHYSACSGCDLYIRTFRDMSPRNILHREADMLRPVSRRVSATQMMTFWYFLAMTKHNLSIFVNKDCQSKSFFLGAGQANSLLSLTVADVFSWVLRHQLQRCFCLCQVQSPFAPYAISTNNKARMWGKKISAWISGRYSNQSMQPGFLSLG